jgi:hypothetical protein
VPPFLNGQNDLGFESVAQNFADFIESSFDFLADDRSDFVVPASVFHVHGASSTKVRSKKSD